MVLHAILPANIPKMERHNYWHSPPNRVNVNLSIRIMANPAIQFTKGRITLGNMNDEQNVLYSRRKNKKERDKEALERVLS
jgi:hypothetical protein